MKCPVTEGTCPEGKRPHGSRQPTERRCGEWSGPAVDWTRRPANDRVKVMRKPCGKLERTGFADSAGIWTREPAISHPRWWSVCPGYWTVERVAFAGRAPECAWFVRARLIWWSSALRFGNQAGRDWNRRRAAPVPTEKRVGDWPCWHTSRCWTPGV